MRRLGELLLVVSQSSSSSSVLLMLWSTAGRSEGAAGRSAAAAPLGAAGSACRAGASRRRCWSARDAGRTAQLLVALPCASPSEEVWPKFLGGSGSATAAESAVCCQLARLDCQLLTSSRPLPPWTPLESSQAQNE